ncbi:MAG: glucose-6-phosphate isomerase [Burkholderiales bacterium]
MTAASHDPGQTALPEIASLQAHAARLQTLALRDLLRDDPTRSTTLALDAGPIYADFARQRIDTAVLHDLEAWALRCGFAKSRDDLFAGRIVNPTEQRPALHTVLRGVGGDPELAAAVALERGRMAELADRIRTGALPGFRDTPITTLVCIGIGGSDLGPRLVCDALAREGDFDLRFVANVDPDDLSRALRGLDAEKTAFAVISKTFTTRETLANAAAARAWLLAGGCPQASLAGQFIGITAGPEAARRWGIRDALMLTFWEGVGGRYSLWSSVGFGVAVACGVEAFDALLDGAALIDRHFRDAPLSENLPARIGLISVWNRSFLGMASQAVVPYAERLRLLPAWLQQLVMESNGKSAAIAGGALALKTAPVIWGTSGTNAQHSYFQQLHQGSDIVPVDFIVARRSRADALDADDDRHRTLVANCLAQSAALAIGKTSDDPHRFFPGNRPSSMLIIAQLDAQALGALLACYEHATFTAAVVLGINPFDQFGVELGKVLAGEVESLLAGGAGAGLDATTHALANRLR